MSEHTIRIPMGPMRALDLLAQAISDPDWWLDYIYRAFRAQVPDWAEHGWELHAVAGAEDIIVTARRKA